ncbi:MAG: DNA recombination protein RmuC, partial [Bdellovibrionales bacterium]|nr:DNA recombination protein RmuC [Bdellovibrionales bacterium]
MKMESLSLALAFIALSTVLGFLLWRKAQQTVLLGFQKESLENENHRLKTETEALRVHVKEFQDEAQSLRGQIHELQKESALESLRLSEGERRLSEQRELLSKAQDQFQTVFQNLAGKTLHESSEAFLRLAKERLDQKSTEAKGTFDEKIHQFQKLVDPIRETLKKVEEDLVRTERVRTEQFGAMTNHLIQVAQSSESVRKEAGLLTSALKRPEVRGSWGELQLRRVVELAGMSRHCDFEEQVSVQTGDGRQRPDLIVHLPNGRDIVVDSKAVLDSFLLALEAETEEKKRGYLESHARNLRIRVQDLAKKAYWEQFEKSPDFAVLFIPNEALLSAAVDVDRSLIEDALDLKIVIATPMTLVALLKAVAYGWHQDKMAQEAKTILATSAELLSRLKKWLDHLGGVGAALEKATDSYNKAVSSLESRVMPSARRIEELTAAQFNQSEKDLLPAMTEVETKARLLTIQSEP